MPLHLPDPTNALAATATGHPRPTRAESEPALILLDLDGTLMDSAPGILTAIRYAYSSLGIPTPSEEVLRTFLGPPLEVSLPQHGVPSDRVAEGIAAYREAFSGKSMYDNSVFPGIPEALTLLRQKAETRPLRLVVATSKPEVFARQLTAHFGLDSVLDAVYGATLDGSRSLKADVIAHALASEVHDTVDPARTIMVGDRRHDVLGASAHGLRTIGVTWGYGSPEELTQAGASTLARSPAELVKALTALVLN